MRISDLENIKSIISDVNQELEGKRVKFIGYECSPNDFIAGRPLTEPKDQNKINSDSFFLKKIVFSEWDGSLYFLGAPATVTQDTWWKLVNSVVVTERTSMEEFHNFIQNNCSIELQREAQNLQNIDWKSNEHYLKDDTMKKLCDKINSLPSIGSAEENEVIDLIFSDAPNQFNIQKRYSTLSGTAKDDNNTFKIMFKIHSRVIQSIFDCYNPYRSYNFDGSLKKFTKPI